MGGVRVWLLVILSAALEARPTVTRVMTPHGGVEKDDAPAPEFGALASSIESAEALIDGKAPRSSVPIRSARDEPGQPEPHVGGVLDASLVDAEDFVADVSEIALAETGPETGAETANAAVQPPAAKADKAEPLKPASNAGVTWGVTAAVVVLVWGGVMYVWGMDRQPAEEPALEKPRRSMVAGRATAARGTIAFLGHLPFDEDGEEQEHGAPAQHGAMTVNEATVNMITTMIGAGVLAFPAITASLGWVVAPIFIIIAGTVNTWICMILANVLERASKRQHVETLRDVGTVCFGPRGGAILEWTLTAFLFCVACVLIVLIANNMDFLVKWDKRWWTGCCGAMLTVIAFLQDVSLLSKLAGLGVAATLMYVIGIAGASANAINSFPEESRKHDTWPEGDNASVMSLCNSFAVLLFGFHCVSLIPSFFHDMKEPERLPTAIMRANGFAVGLYLVVGLVGYYGFGLAVDGNVVNSMCQAPGCPGMRKPPDFTADSTISEAEAGDKMMWGYLIGSSVIVNLAVTLPLICYVLFSAVERACPSLKEERYKSYAMRITSLVVLTGIGMGMPFFMEILGLVSSVMVVLIGLAMPPVLALKMDVVEGNSMNWAYVFLVMLSVFLMTLGLNDALEGLMAAFAASGK